MIEFKDEVRIVLISKQYSETRQFYEEILNLRVLKEWDHGEGRLGVVYAIGNTCLEILQGPASSIIADFYIYIKVGDIDKLWEVLQNRVSIEDSIMTQPWGHRNFSIRDPNGYKLKFFSETN
jgi:catechol 2,3-dioxygenase-like lactoylglutathione lyase family enzyme